MSIYRRIIAPVDDSPAAQAGLRAAIALADDQKAELKLFTVVDEAPGDYAGGELGWVESDALNERLRADAQRVLDEAVALAVGTGVQPESEVVEAPKGHVAATIHRSANQWRADLLVIGTHGRHGLSQMLLGSTAQALVRTPELPVLVVPGVGAKEPPA